jgi:hypothetical protein
VAFAVQELAGGGLKGQGLGLVALVLIYVGLSAGRRSLRDLIPRLWKKGGEGLGSDAGPVGNEDLAGVDVPVGGLTPSEPPRAVPI